MRFLRMLLPMLAVAMLSTTVVTSAAPSPFAGLVWRSIGPAVSGGRLGAVAGTDRDPDLYYVGAADGGVWKTTDAGTSWHPVFDEQSVASIGAIAIDPQNASVVWVGTGESSPRNDVTQGDGVYKTSDGGHTWNRVLALHNSLVSGVIVDSHDANHVIVAALGDPFADSPDRGIYLTTDGGKNWSKTLFLDERTGVSDMVADPAHPAVLYAGMWSYRRTGWSSQSGGDADGLYRSIDNGATWTKLTGNGLPSGTLGRIGLATTRSNPTRIYALIESKSGLLWRSDDAGATWTMVSADPLIDERPFYYTRIFADPTDADRVWTTSVHLTVSLDGGKHFTITGRGTHGDHHAMWIAQDGKRIIEGNDGGVVFSHDGGHTWDWQKTLPISQLYHIAYSREMPYRVCAPLQDNGIHCAPGDPLNERGVSASQWLTTGGGDGTWALFDPRDPSYIWQTSGGGNYAGALSILNMHTGETYEVAPYVRDQNVIDPKALTYRFNWETPIAFDPFDTKLAYVAGNVLFATRDRGTHWRVLSPDLTRNRTAHEVVTGGITLDGTGAETSETILTIAPSHVAKHELWIGTDDGVVQLTRDGGTHWRDVTPSGIAPDGRFPSISPSATDAATAYAVYDRHMVGDRAPYVFVTHDFGAHWRASVNGLPIDDEARSILADSRTPHLLYLGLERSLWASWNDGASWERISSNLPPVSVHDIALQPDRNDVLLATHGRGAYVLDDATPLQQLARARAAGDFLFPIRAAIAWNEHGYWATRTDGEAPPYGAIVSYYLAAPATNAPKAEVVDASGAVVRSFTLTNNAGINRFTWDLTGEPPHGWRFAPEWNSGYGSGAPVLPGTYAVRLHVGSRTLVEHVAVQQDPRTRYTRAQLALHQRQVRALLDDLSRLDDALNMVSTVAQEAPARVRALPAGSAPGLGGGLTSIGTDAQGLIASTTSNPANDQDNDFLPDLLRERLQTELDTYFDSTAPATAERLREDAALHALTLQRLASFTAFSQRVRMLDSMLRGLGLPPLDHLTHEPRRHGQGDDTDRR